MQAGTVHMEHYNKVVETVHRNICTNYGLEVPKSKWEILVVENDKAYILWDFQIQTDKLMMANQPDIEVLVKLTPL